MKKIVLLPVLAGITLLSVPYVSQADDMIQGGVFAGVAGTAVMPNYGYKNISGIDIKKSSHSMLLRPELFVGYGELVSSNNLYMAFDAGVQLGIGKGSELSYYKATPAITNNVKEKTVYYVDALPGIILGSQGSVFYGIIGAMDGSFTLSQTGGGSSNFSHNAGHFGYRIGVGYNMPLASNFTVGLKYVFSDFGSIKYQNGDYKYELNPKNNALSVALTYTFGNSNGNTSSPFLGD